MHIDPTIFTCALLVSTLLLLGAATIAILRLQRLLQKLASVPATDAQPLQPVATETGDALALRLDALQQLADELASRQAVEPPTHREIPYESAVRMARSGAGVDELTRSCGLKKGEAELLLKLHGKRASATASIH